MVHQVNTSVLERHPQQMTSNSSRPAKNTCNQRLIADADQHSRFTKLPLMQRKCNHVRKHLLPPITPHLTSYRLHAPPPQCHWFSFTYFLTFINIFTTGINNLYHQHHHPHHVLTKQLKLNGKINKTDFTVCKINQFQLFPKVHLLAAHLNLK